MRGSWLVTTMVLLTACGDPPEPPVRVAVGDRHTMAVKADATLWAWGSNTIGQLGDGTTTSQTAPVQVGRGFAAVAAGNLDTVATPVQVGSDFASVAAGASHTAAVKASGAIWAWGANSAGQLGDDSKTDRTAPVEV
jgi:alpha-tubulin suppressor-like RCC1 family protein